MQYVLQPLPQPAHPSPNHTKTRISCRSAHLPLGLLGVLMREAQDIPKLDRQFSLQASAAASIL